MDNVLLQKEGPIGIVSLNRESTMNSLDMDTFEELGKVITEVAQDESIRVVIVTGIGQAFCSGLDLSVMNAIHEMGDEDFQLWLRHAQEKIFNMLEDMEKPTIAAVNGAAIGGGFELALACDIRIATPKARFGLPEIDFGLVPDLGGPQRLTRLANASIAKECIFTCRLMNAEEAFSLRVVNKIVDEDKLMDEAKKFVVNKAPIPISLSKVMVNKSLDSDNRTGMVYAVQAQNICLKSQDHLEAVSAFKEKREPKFFSK
jgi:enoyl-CoA hydratase